jgi:hypothetical protein
VSELRLGAPVPGWAELEPVGPLPPARAYAAAAYDAARQRLVVAGGWWGDVYGDAAQLDDVQQLTLPLAGTPVWSPLVPSGGGGGRMAQGAAAAADEMVVFGGAGAPGDASRADNLSLSYGSARTPWLPCLPRPGRAGR